MAVPSRVSFSDQELDLAEIATHYDALVAALREYYSPTSRTFVERHGIFTAAEVKQELELRLKEVDLACALSVMSAAEAALRRDYLTRAYRKGRDVISRAFKEVYLRKAEKASLEEDILDTWKQVGLMTNRLVSEMKGANNYRHWLAHGRYWTPRFGRNYDYFAVYTIAEEICNVLAQQGASAN